MRFSFENMTFHTHLEENIGGVGNFWAWKYMISQILEENDLDHFITRDVSKPEGDEAKGSYKRSMTNSNGIITVSIKDHLIPHVSAFKTPKEVYDALTKIFEGKNINRNMTLRN